jgi:hypothetical protein
MKIYKTIFIDNSKIEMEQKRFIRYSQMEDYTKEELAEQANFWYDGFCYRTDLIKILPKLLNDYTLEDALRIIDQADEGENWAMRICKPYIANINRE